MYGVVEKSYPIKQNKTKNAPIKEIKLWTDRRLICKHQSTSWLVHAK